MNDETQPVDQPAVPQPVSPQRRLQQLQAIPERQRTDAEWDELNELEISLNPVNRDRGGEPNMRRQDPAAPASNRPRPSGQKHGGQKPNGPRPVGVAGELGKKPFRKFNKRPPKKPNTP